MSGAGPPTPPTIGAFLEARSIAPAPTLVVGARAEAAAPRATVGRYVVLGRLGAGGMGDVLTVRDPDLGREIAVKLIRGADPRQLHGFLREAQITGQLQHPNIVPIHELGLTDDGQPYYAMKQVAGETLRARLQTAARAELLATFAKVCDGVAFAHEHGVIHRDLKPDNIMVGRFGEVLVLDWGLARLIGHADPVAEQVQPPGDSQIAAALADADASATPPGAILGTPAYMAPEQARGEVARLDARSDVYALGAILYELLTGVPAYHGGSAWDVLHRVGRGALVPPRERAPERRVPRELEAVVLRAMALEPDDRYASVEALAADVAAYRSGHQLEAADYSPLQALAKWTWRHRALAAGLLAVLVCGLAILAVQRWRARTALQGRIADAARQADEHRLRVPALAALRAAVAMRGPEAEHDVRRWRPVLDGWLAVVSALDRGLSHAPDDGRLRAARRAAGEAVGWAAVLVGDHAFGGHSMRALRTWGTPQSDVDRLAAGVAADAEARVALRARRLGWILDDLRGGLARRTRRFPGWRLDDYVAEAATDRSLASAMTVAAELARMTRDGHVWTPNDRTLARFACRTLGRIGLPVCVAPLAALTARAPDRALAVEGAIGLCLTRRPEALAPLLALSRTLGTGSPAWRRVTPYLRRVPEPRALAHADEPATRARRARSRWLRGDTAGALADISAAIEAAPARMAHRVLRAVIHAARSDHAAARTDLDHVLTRAPDDAQAWSARGVARYHQGDVAGATADFARAIALAPRVADYRTHRGHALRTLGRHADAQADYDRAIALAPDDPVAYCGRGNVHLARGELDRARADYDLAIVLDAGYVEPRYNLGQILYREGRLEAAVAAFGATIDLAPTHRLAYLGRGLVHRKAGRPRRALADYNAALQLRPDWVLALVQRAEVHLSLRDASAAAADIDRAIELDPRFPDAWIVRGRLLARDPVRARAALDEALRLDPDRAAAWALRGTTRARAGDLSGALADLDRAVALAPGDAHIRYNRAQLRHRAKAPARALEDLDHALRLQPAYVNALILRGIVRSDRGRVDAALADYRRALELEPTAWLAHASLAVVHQRRQHWAAARAAYRKALEHAPPSRRAALRQRLKALEGR